LRVERFARRFFFLNPVWASAIRMENRPQL
jgi:hypothetical protein